jgi:hypothetical protein
MRRQLFIAIGSVALLTAGCASAALQSPSTPSTNQAPVSTAAPSPSPLSRTSPTTNDGSVLSTSTTVSTKPTPTAPASDPGTVPKLQLWAQGTNEPSLSQSLAALGNSCAHIDKHQFEICYAYVVNNTYLARLPFYKFGRSGSDFFADKLKARYQNPALGEIAQQAKGWPGAVGIDVYFPTVRIDELTIVKSGSGELTSAKLYTHESWLVRSENGGRVWFSENNQAHTITLKRVPDDRFTIGGHVYLHKWVVTNIQ